MLVKILYFDCKLVNLSIDSFKERFRDIVACSELGAPVEGTALPAKVIVSTI